MLLDIWRVTAILGNFLSFSISRERTYFYSVLMSESVNYFKYLRALLVFIDLITHNRSSPFANIKFDEVLHKAKFPLSVSIKFSATQVEREELLFEKLQQKSLCFTFFHSNYILQAEK